MRNTCVPLRWPLRPWRPPATLALLGGAVLLGALVPPRPARAEYRFEPSTAFDHREQWGIRADLVTAYGFVVAPGTAGTTGGALGLEAGVSYGLPYTGDEVSLRVRSLLVGPLSGLSFLGGYRVYFGYENWKTFTDLDLLVFAGGGLSAGGHLAAGVMYDVGPPLGFAASFGVVAAAGQIFVAAFEMSVGAQLRF